MRLLLDTHVAVWALATPERLSAKARNIIADSTNEICVSAITIAEIAIKYMLGKRADVMPFSAAEALSAFAEAGYKLVDLTAAHATTLELLPPLHKDPFDRLLVAQAFAEPFRLVTHDSKLAAYDNSIIFV